MRPAIVQTGVVFLGVGLYAPTASACGDAAAVGLVWATRLLLLLGLSLISVISLRAASAALGRMVLARPTRARRIGQRLCQLGYGVSIASAVVWAGLLATVVLM